jgi:hypothetical protein
MGNCDCHVGVDGYTVDIALPFKGGNRSTFCEKFSGAAPFMTGCVVEIVRFGTGRRGAS